MGCRGFDTIKPRQDFIDWAANKPIVPEVRLAIWNWLDGEQESLDTLITNEPTGAEYWITGARQDHGAFCLVKFTENVNWE